MTGPNATRDPDSVLAAWLDEGPTDLPDATRRAIVTALPTTPQHRRGLPAPWRSPMMLMFARGAALLAVAVVAIGTVAFLAGRGGDVGGPGPSPVASPSPTPGETFLPLPTLDATFVSSSYGFQIRYPAGWAVTHGSPPWPLGAHLEPTNSVSDSIMTPSGIHRVRISGASIDLPSGTTIEAFRAWASPFSAPFTADPCTPVAPLPVPVTLAYRASPGQSPQPVGAVVSINGCHALAGLGGYVYDLQAIAGGRGYGFTIDGEIATSDALAWLGTITLEPAAAPAATALPSPSASN